MPLTEGLSQESPRGEDTWELYDSDSSDSTVKELTPEGGSVPAPSHKSLEEDCPLCRSAAGLFAPPPGEPITQQQCACCFMYETLNRLPTQSLGYRRWLQHHARALGVDPSTGEPIRPDPPVPPPNRDFMPPRPLSERERLALE